MARNSAVPVVCIATPRLSIEAITISAFQLICLYASSGVMQRVRKTSSAPSSIATGRATKPRLETISTKIADLNDTEAKLISIVENVQRENLTEVEEAFTFKNYIDGGMSVKEVGDSLGKLDDRVAEKLKTLSGHYYIQFQENRIQELAKDNENLKNELTELKQTNDGNFTARIHNSKNELTTAINDGWEFVAQISDGEFLLRKKLT